MTVICTHCGANTEDTITCDVCGRALPTSADGGALGRVNLRRVVVQSGEACAAPVDALSTASSAPPAAALGFGDGLTDFGAFDEPASGAPGALDLSALLGPALGDDEHGVIDESPEHHFSFDEAVAPPSATVAPDTTGGGDTGWRVRSERGLVYELATADAVVTWIQGKGGVEALRISRAGEAFAPVANFPEIAERVGAVTPPLTTVETVEPLSLATPATPTRAPERTVSKASTVRGTERPERQAPVESGEPRGHLGFGFVLGVTVMAGVLSAGFVAATLRLGGEGLPPKFEPSGRVEAPVAPELKRAIEAFDADHLTSAVSQLKPLAAAGSVEAGRYLVRALHGANRHEEARTALVLYRQSVVNLELRRHASDSK